MRVIFLSLVVLLSACAGQEKVAPPMPEVVYIHDDEQSLEEICRSLEVYAIDVGINRLSRKNRQTRTELEEAATTIQVNQVVQDDMVELINTIYTLPIKTYEDVDAVAYLIYKNCMMK